MTNIPDLTNASPGDVYQGPDGRQWEVRYVQTKPLISMISRDDEGRRITRIGEMDCESWKGYEKVDG